MLSPKELEGMLSTGDGEWQTPRLLFEQLNDIFNFKLDAAASKKNALCKQYLTKKDNALDQHWCNFGGAVFLNPPYGRNVGDWVWKAQDESTHRSGHHAVVCLLAARTETKWFQQIVFQHASIVCFLKTRVKFRHPTKHFTSPAFPSVVVVFGQIGDRTWMKKLSQLGHTVAL